MTSISRTLAYFDLNIFFLFIINKISELHDKYLLIIIINYYDYYVSQNGSPCRERMYNSKLMICDHVK